MKSTPWFTPLPTRGLIQIEGPDRISFLQSLITNDMEKLQPGHLLYACLLNAQGKFLHDFFLSQGPDAILIDCEGKERTKDLYNRLNMYRLRADVKISYEENHPVYAIINSNIGLPDPRHLDLGNRTFEKPDAIEERPFKEWDSLRIALCIPDGSRDLKVGSSTMDEARMDTINAIDYKKGCYIGQELTARMHYRGLGKKHLYTITLQGLNLKQFPESFTNLEKEGKLIGEMRSHCGNKGLALLKDETANQVTPGAATITE